MTKLTDYNFCNSWQLGELNMQPNEAFVVLLALGELKKGEVVKFVGFDDVDNHYGIFVFVDPNDKVLEVCGDCSGPDHSTIKALKAALSKMQ